MNESELRALVRDAVARHLGAAQGAARPMLPPAAPRPAGRETGSAGHPSQAIYITLTSGGEACLIEPAVACNHCGHCKTHGY